jgi:hypothetical protein
MRGLSSHHAYLIGNKTTYILEHRISEIYGKNEQIRNPNWPQRVLLLHHWSYWIVLGKVALVTHVSYTAWRLVAHICG